MKLSKRHDRYQIAWRCHIDKALDARKWCYSLWQGDWGEAMFGVPNQVGYADHLFFFRLEQHANWFMLKYNSV